MKKAEAEVAIKFQLSVGVGGGPVSDENRAIKQAQKILLESYKRQVKLG